MIYSLSLGTASLLAGLLLLALAACALVVPAATERWLRALPRSKGWGIFFLVLAAVLSWVLIKQIDLGEFSNWRPRILFLIPVAAVLTGIYVDEFLAARSLGMLVLLAAEPALEAAFLKPQGSRLFLVSLVYLAIVVAMYWIGKPYLLRNQLQWVTTTRTRLRGVAFAVAAYGVLLSILALTAHRAA